MRGVGTIDTMDSQDGSESTFCFRIRHYDRIKECHRISLEIITFTEKNVVSIGIVTRIHWLILRYNVPDDRATVEEKVGVRPHQQNI